MYLRFSVSILFFFKEPTFLERAPGGSHPSGGPHPAGRASVLKKGGKRNYVNPSIPKDKKFDEYHFTKWVLSDERFQKGNGR